MSVASRSGDSFIHDHIGRFDIAVQHFVGMRCTQRRQQRAAHRDRIHHRTADPAATAPAA